MNKLLSSLILIVVFAVAAFACGVAQDISGMVVAEGRSLVTVQVVGDPSTAQTRQTNQFGYFVFREMMPCVDYQIRVQAKEEFPVAVFTLPGDHGVHITLFPLE